MKPEREGRETVTKVCKRYGKETMVNWYGLSENARAAFAEAVGYPLDDAISPGEAEDWSAVDVVRLLEEKRVLIQDARHVVDQAAENGAATAADLESEDLTLLGDALREDVSHNPDQLSLPLEAIEKWLSNLDDDFQFAVDAVYECDWGRTEEPPASAEPKDDVDSFGDYDDDDPGAGKDLEDVFEEAMRKGAAD